MIEINNWLKLTGSEFVIDPKEFKLSKIEAGQKISIKEEQRGN